MEDTIQAQPDQRWLLPWYLPFTQHVLMGVCLQVTNKKKKNYILVCLSKYNLMKPLDWGAVLIVVWPSCLRKLCSMGEHASSHGWCDEFHFRNWDEMLDLILLLTECLWFNLISLAGGGSMWGPNWWWHSNCYSECNWS